MHFAIVLFYIFLNFNFHLKGDQRNFTAKHRQYILLVCWSLSASAYPSVSSRTTTGFCQTTIFQPGKRLIFQPNNIPAAWNFRREYRTNLLVHLFRFSMRSFYAKNQTTSPLPSQATELDLHILQCTLQNQRSATYYVVEHITLLTGNTNTVNRYKG